MLFCQPATNTNSSTSFKVKLQVKPERSASTLGKNQKKKYWETKHHRGYIWVDALVASWFLWKQKGKQLTRFASEQQKSDFAET